LAQLALHAEGDLPEDEALRVERHLGGCPGCREVFEDIRASQSVLKTLRQETCSAAACADMRREVMSMVRNSEDSRQWGQARQWTQWTTRVERAVLFGLRRRGFALASLAAVTAMVSALLLAQLGRVVTQSAAVYDGNRLILPEGYREWTPLLQNKAHGVYINSDAYRDFIRTGEFPEGAVLVRESGASGVQVSVKDSARFSGGWGYFEFSSFSGGSQSRANSAAPASEASCRSCHEQNAETDQVFTQSYPVLKVALGERS
jgi:hypothetical protein